MIHIEILKLDMPYLNNTEKKKLATNIATPKFIEIFDNIDVRVCTGHCTGSGLNVVERTSKNEVFFFTKRNTKLACERSVEK